MYANPYMQKHAMKAYWKQMKLAAKYGGMGYNPYAMGMGGMSGMGYQPYMGAMNPGA